MRAVTPSPARANAIVVAIALAAVALWAALSPPGANDVAGGDEGYYGTMARNILADARYLASPAQTPLGPPGDKPPVYPALLAVAVRLLGPTEAALRWPSLLCSGVVIAASAWLLRNVRGAADVVEGRTRTLQGIQARDSATVDLILDEPLAFFLSLLTMHEASIIPALRVRASRVVRSASALNDAAGNRAWASPNRARRIQISLPRPSKSRSRRKTIVSGISDT